MKLLLATLGPAALLLAPAFARAQDQLYTATRQQLDATKTLIAQENAWNKGDMAAYLAFYKDAPDTVAMLAGPARGLENIRAGFLTNFSNPSIMGELEESNVEARHGRQLHARHRQLSHHAQQEERWRPHRHLHRYP